MMRLTRLHHGLAVGLVTTTTMLSAAQAATADRPVEVPYTADYYFWKATGKPNP